MYVKILKAFIIKSTIISTLEDFTNIEVNLHFMQYKCLKLFIFCLQERFKQTMNRIAELSDERQQLEHLVTQLQGETETIGE